MATKVRRRRRKVGSINKRFEQTVPDPKERAELLTWVDGINRDEPVRSWRYSKPTKRNPYGKTRPPIGWPFLHGVKKRRK